MIRITQEEYDAARAEKQPVIDKVSRTTKTIVYIMLICFTILVILIIAFAVLEIKGDPARYAVGAAALIIGAAGAAVYNIWRKKLNDIEFKYDHYISDKFAMKALKALTQDPFSPETEKIIAENIALSPDRRVKAGLCSMMIEMLVLKGDMENSYRFIVNDPQLFAEDRFFEIKYYNELVTYYTVLAYMGDKGDAVGYAEDSYRNMERVYLECDDSIRKDIAVLVDFIDAQQSISFMRGEWQVCRDIIEMRKNVMKKYSPEKIYSVLTAPNDLMLAECLYHLGEYNEALKICDDAGPKLVDLPYQLDRANRLAAELHRILDSRAVTSSD